MNLAVVGVVETSSFTILYYIAQHRHALDVVGDKHLLELSLRLLEGSLGNDERPISWERNPISVDISLRFIFFQANPTMLIWVRQMHISIAQGSDSFYFPVHHSTSISIDASWSQSRPLAARTPPPNPSSSFNPQPQLPRRAPPLWRAQCICRSRSWRVQIVKTSWVACKYYK